MEKLPQKTEQISSDQLVSYLDTMGLSKKLTENEKNTFLQISQAFGLNPFKREIYCMKYGEQSTIIVGYETYIKRAERTGLLDGWNVVTSGEGNNVKATITIHRKDRTYAFIHEVVFSEYFQNNKIWKEKPITMIKKVAMAQGFRLCFSDELGGMPYTSEEMPDKTEDIQHVEVIEVKKSITDERFNKAIDLIKKGNNDAYVSLLKFDLTEDQKKQIELAVSEGINATKI